MTQLNNSFQLLVKKLGLDAAESLNEEIISLEVGDFTCHFKEYPANHITLYTVLEKMPEVGMDLLLSILSENHFSEQLLSPVFSYDQNNQCFLIWNRQPVQGLTGDGILEQLEAVMAFNETVQTILSEGGNDDHFAVSQREPHGIHC